MTLLALTWTKLTAFHTDCCGDSGFGGVGAPVGGWLPKASSPGSAILSATIGVAEGAADGASRGNPCLTTLLVTPSGAQVLENTRFRPRAHSGHAVAQSDAAPHPFQHDGMRVRFTWHVKHRGGGALWCGVANWANQRMCAPECAWFF